MASGAVCAVTVYLTGGGLALQRTYSRYPHTTSRIMFIVLSATSQAKLHVHVSYSTAVRMNGMTIKDDCSNNANEMGEEWFL